MATEGDGSAPVDGEEDELEHPETATIWQRDA